MGLSEGVVAGVGVCGRAWAGGRLGRWGWIRVLTPAGVGVRLGGLPYSPTFSGVGPAIHLAGRGSGVRWIRRSTSAGLAGLPAAGGTVAVHPGLAPRCSRTALDKSCAGRRAAS